MMPTEPRTICIIGAFISLDVHCFTGVISDVSVARIKIAIIGVTNNKGINLLTKKL